MQMENGIMNIKKQQDKDLLLKYLCMALPYGVKCRQFKLDSQICTLTADLLNSVNNLEPYLRSMSSMTEEEKMEFDNFCVIDELVWKGNSDIGYKNQAIIMSNAIIWLLKKHFDFMDLIAKGLALEASEENNPYK